jgi:hypothetical protein
MIKGIHCEESSKPLLQAYEADFRFKPRVDLGNPFVKQAFARGVPASSQRGLAQRQHWFRWRFRGIFLPAFARPEAASPARPTFSFRATATITSNISRRLKTRQKAAMAPTLAFPPPKWGPGSR